MRAFAAVLVLAGCAAPEPAPGIAKADFAGEWEHRITVLGAEGGEPVPMLESHALVRFEIGETFLVARTIDGELRLGVRIIVHLPDPTDPLATRDTTAGDFGGGTICETVCPRWWERPRMRLDMTTELVAALPIDGMLEPVPLDSTAPDAERPELEASGRLVWRFEARYLLTADDPTLDGALVRVRHELVRGE